MAFLCNGDAQVEEKIAIHPFMRSEPQILALGDMALAWQSGKEAFWEFDFILAATQRPGSLAFFAAEDSSATLWDGCIFADVGPYTADLLYVFVRPESRRLGLARLLLERLIEALYERRPIESLLLEVRVSNVAAQTLYERLGMKRIHTRKNYYRDGEDAHIYQLELTR